MNLKNGDVKEKRIWLPYILVTVCTDIVTVSIGMAYSNCAVATVHIGNSVH